MKKDSGECLERERERERERDYTTGRRGNQGKSEKR
jgi:hypothetical protein